MIKIMSELRINNRNERDLRGGHGFESHWSLRIVFWTLFVTTLSYYITARISSYVFLNKTVLIAE